MAWFEFSRTVPAWLATRRFSFRGIYWIGGTQASAISPFAENLTTALLLATAIVVVGGGVITVRFAITVAIAVAFENYPHLPAAVGMMSGLGLLKLFDFIL